MRWLSAALGGGGGRDARAAPYAPVGQSEDAEPLRVLPPADAGPRVCCCSLRQALTGAVVAVTAAALLVALVAPEMVSLPPRGGSSGAVRGPPEDGAEAAAAAAESRAAAVVLDVRGEVAASAWGNPMTRLASLRLEADGSADAAEGRWRNVAGQPTMVVPAGGSYHAVYRNRLDVPTILHVHGQTPAQQLDGVPYLSAPPLRPNCSRKTSFPAREGTYFVHSHYGTQHGDGLSAPVVVEGAAPPGYPLPGVDGARDVLFYVDEECPYMPHMGGMTVSPSEALSPNAMFSCNHTAVLDMMRMMHAHEEAPPKCPELRAATKMHIRYARMLANGRALGKAAEPRRVVVRPGERLRVRAVNACGMSNLRLTWEGAAAASLVAVDGNWVRPRPVAEAWIGVGNRADVLLVAPADGGAITLLAESDGGEETKSPRAALLLFAAADAGDNDKAAAKRAAKVLLPEPVGPAPGLHSLQHEAALRAWAPLPPQDAEPRRVPVVLENRGVNRVMNGEAFVITAGEGGASPKNPIRVRAGERVRLEIENRTPDSHAMHLHGHVFQVVAIDGVEIPGGGAVRDTILVPGGCRTVAVEFVADNPGEWIFHCHMLFHLALGMATTVVYV